MLPAIFCFDDLRVAWLFPKLSIEQAIALQREEKAGVERPKGNG